MSPSTRVTVFLLLVLAGRVHAQPAPQPLPVLDVPFISQSEALCGGAAAAMVLRYWGERGLTAESFAHLVDRSAAGIRTDALVAELQHRGWNAVGLEGTADLVSRELADGRPVVTLIEDRPGTFHYIVIVAATAGSIVFHDPARAPFRVMTHDEFRRRWKAADRWMAVVVPPDPPPAARPEADAASADVPLEDDPTTCEQMVARGVRLAQADDLEGAERSLGAALACPGAAAVRELAGLRLLQRRWPEVAELASAAVSEDPRDAHAWRLLATARFVQNDRAGALDAWNRVGEPRLDLIVVTGLTRTRQRVVEQTIAVGPGDLLTNEVFARAERRLEALPAIASAGLGYVPLSGGLAELTASVFEHPLVPSGRWSFVGLGLGAAVRREVEVTLGSPTGGGERVNLSWRFWPDRPRFGGAISAPAPWGGVWGASLFSERQPFDSGIAPARRLAGRLEASNWLTSGMRLTLRGGTDRWRDVGTFAHAGTALRLVTQGGRIDGGIDLSAWTGPSTFSSAAAAVTLQSSLGRSGRVYLARTGAALTTAATPADLWFAGDTGHARPVLLRAHPVLDDGALRAERIGRYILHASAEAQHWWRGPAGSGVAAAVFADAAQVGKRLRDGAPRDIDAGIGARLAIPGVDGVFRVDLAKGLRDGATVLSFAYEP